MNFQKGRRDIGDRKSRKCGTDKAPKVKAVIGLDRSGLTQLDVYQSGASLEKIRAGIGVF